MTEEKMVEKTVGEEEKVLKKKNGGSNKIKAAVGIVGLMLAPIISFLLFEYVTGNLSMISRSMAALNIYWVYLFYILIFAVSGSSRITMGFSSVVLYIISLAETFVVSFRGRPIILTEVLALKTAISVASSYTFDITKQMALAGLAVLALNAVFWFTPVRIKGLKFRAANAAVCVLAVYLGVQGFFGNIMPKMGLAVNLWSMSESYQKNGFLLSTAVSMQYMVEEEPQGYSDQKLEDIYQKSMALLEERQAEVEEETIQPVNIICIMNESLSDLSVVADFDTNIPYFPFLSTLTENTVRGSLCVPVYGSLTSNTEYEFLTGDSMALLPTNSIAYQFFVKPDSLSMVSTLKSQGYKAIAMHPYPGENWNRNSCYKNMGFDEFWDEEEYTDSEILRLYVTDKADYDKIIEAVEDKETPDDKLFIFNVTMQNHGGYDYTYEHFNQEVWLTGEREGKYPKTDQYLSLMKKSDEAFEYLLDYFKSCEEPTMIVMFGDHQPGIENEFYEDIYGIASSDVERKDMLMWYETPFVIWTNYEQPAKDMGRLSAVYLASHVLDLANVEITPYDAFLLNFSETMPVVHFLGCYDNEGEFYRWSDAENGEYSFTEQLMEYEMLVYNHSLANQEKQKLYMVP